MDRIEEQLRIYYEAEAEAGLRPAHGDRRRLICEKSASRMTNEGRRTVVDVRAGPASDHAAFEACGIGYVGVDLSVANGVIAAGFGQTVVPASLLNLALRSSSRTAALASATITTR